MRGAQPVVMVMSDGSGGADVSRIDYSRRHVQSVGGTLAAHSGRVPDRDWYSAIRDGDVAFFESFITSSLELLAQAQPDYLVCDAVEHYNPLHDLANVVGHCVRSQLDPTLPVYTFAIMKNPQRQDDGKQLELSTADMAMRHQAARDYLPLAHELPGHIARLETPSETLHRDSGYGWPDDPGEKPYYEVFGEERVSRGIYSEVITYRQHIQPLARALMARFARAEA